MRTTTAMDDNMVLPYISRLLMEDDIDTHFFYQYPDHPALLQAQLPFARILSQSSDDDTCSALLSSPCSSSSGSGSGSADIRSWPSFNGGAEAEEALFSGDKGPADLDMLNLATAFLKCKEEANTFLPTTTTNNSQGGGGRKKNRDAADLEVGTRATKLMAPEPEQDEAAARHMFDEMMLQEQQICMKGGIARQGGATKLPRRRRGAGDGTPETVDLHTLLLHCAQAVATDDHWRAHELLRQIKQHSSPRGDAAQRLAHCFAQGLEARLAGTGSQVYQSLMAKRTSVVDFLKAYQLYMAACCCKNVAFTFSNETICHAVAGRTRLHIVDYGLSYGFQWPGLLRQLAAREGGPPEVTVTGIDLPQPGFRPAYHVEETGRRLSNCAREFGVPFKFHGIVAKRETIRLEDLSNIDRDHDEVLVVISLCHFRNLMDDSVFFDSPSPRDQVLDNIQKMRPDVFIHGIVNGAYGATYFPTRFREALFYYSAQLDLLDATVPRDNEERLLVEQDIFGRAALNVIACEGADRVERPETYKQWQARNDRAGLRQLPLNPQVVKVVLDKVKDNYHKDFVVDKDRRWLLHRWKGRVLYALSTWVAQDNSSDY